VLDAAAVRRERALKSLAGAPPLDDCVECPRRRAECWQGGMCYTVALARSGAGRRRELLESARWLARAERWRSERHGGTP